MRNRLPRYVLMEGQLRSGGSWRYCRSSCTVASILLVFIAVLASERACVEVARLRRGWGMRCTRQGTAQLWIWATAQDPAVDKAPRLRRDSSSPAEKHPTLMNCGVGAHPRADETQIPRNGGSQAKRSHPRQEIVPCGRSELISAKGAVRTQPNGDYLLRIHRRRKSRLIDTQQRDVPATRGASTRLGIYNLIFLEDAARGCDTRGTVENLGNNGGIGKQQAA